MTVQNDAFSGLVGTDVLDASHPHFGKVHPAIFGGDGTLDQDVTGGQLVKIAD
jgi:hypothetical protein